MKRWMIPLMLFVGFGLPTVHSEADRSAVVESKRQTMMELIMDRLRSFQPTDETRRVKPVINEYSDIYGVGYRVIKDSLIEFSDHSWMYMVMHSGDRDAEIGDIILAIDDRGRLFENAAHVCGGVVQFVAVEKKNAASVDDFIKRFYSEDDLKNWQLR